MYLRSNVYQFMLDDKIITEDQAGFINKFVEDRVFSIYTYDNTMYLSEECDEYFTSVINKEDLLKLSHFFKILANNYDEIMKKL